MEVTVGGDSGLATFEAKRNKFLRFDTVCLLIVCALMLCD